MKASGDSLVDRKIAAAIEEATAPLRNEIGVLSARIQGLTHAFAGKSSSEIAKAGAIPIRSIQLICCRHFGVSHSEMMSDRRQRKIIIPRHVAMYLARRLTPFSLPRIGREFGGRDHTTIFHAGEAMERRLTEDSELAEVVLQLEVECRKLQARL